jgi:hypothetical protein
MKARIPLLPVLVLAAGILLSALLAVQHSDWLVLAAPLSLALAVLAGDALNARMQGRPARPSPAALILAVSFLVAGLIVAATDPVLLRQMMPLLGACAAVTLPLRPRKPDPACPRE